MCVYGYEQMDVLTSHLIHMGVYLAIWSISDIMHLFSTAPCVHPTLAILADNGTVRFGSAPPDAAAHSGVVEAFVEGEWQDVCPQRTNSANYLCAQLGYSTALGSSMMTTAPSGSTYTPDWNNNDSRCRHDMYSTEGCVWYHKEGVCKGDTNLRITCAGKHRCIW